MAKWYQKIFNWKGSNQKALSYVGPMRVNGMGQVVWVDDNVDRYITEGYCGNDIVYSIISTCADKEREVPWNAYKVKDESSLKLLEFELSKKDVNLKKCADLQLKALELYTGDSKLNQLLEWPNEEQTFQDLVADSGAAKRLSGNRYLWGNLLKGGANTGKPEEIFLLDSTLTFPVGTRSFPCRKLGYKMQYEQEINFTTEEVLHDKMWNPNTRTWGHNLIGMAPLKAAVMNLTRSQAAKEASTYSFQNLGPDTIIFIEDERLSGTQAEAQAAGLKAKLYEEYSGTVNRKKMAISGYKTGAVNLGLSPVDLNILNQEKWDVVMLANIWHFPHILLFQDASTHDNYKTAEKALATRCAIPYLSSFRGSFNKKLRTDWGYKDTRIIADYDIGVFSELNPDKKDIAEWTSKTPLTVRQIYEQLQIEIPEKYMNDPMIDKIRVPAGTQFLDDFDPANLDNQMNEIDGQDNQDNNNG